MSDPIEIITRLAEKHSIPVGIVYGVCMTESNMNPHAARYEPDYKWLFMPEKVRPGVCSFDTEVMFQKTSIGIMQVMGAVYREYGYRGWLPALFSDVEKQIEFGIRHLSQKFKKYGSINSIAAPVAAYNSGHPVFGPDGTLKNEGYVAKVLRYSKHFLEISS